MDKTPATHRVYNLLILDESGSMQSVRETTINGCFQLLDTILLAPQEHPEQEHWVQFVSFNTSGIHQWLPLQPVVGASRPDPKKYRPDNGTPLHDAVGITVTALRKAINLPVGSYNVAVSILTDGYENASREYDARSVKALITELEKQGWTFQYIGTDHDVDEAADAMGISSRVAYEKSHESMQSTFDSLSEDRANLMRMLKITEDKSLIFFKKGKRIIDENGNIQEEN